MNAEKSFGNLSFRPVSSKWIVLATSILIFFLRLAPCSGQGVLQFRFDDHPPGYATPASTYGESGMGFWNPYGPENLILAGSGIDSLPQNGTAYLQVSTGAKLGFTLTSGMHFNLISFDAAEYVNNLGSVTLQVVGYKSMGVTVTNLFSLDEINDGTGPLQDFQTFYPDSQFLNVYRVDVLTDRWSLDNLVINGVPEPSSGALILLGTLCGLGWSWVRSKRR